MYFVALGVLLLVMKIAEFGPVGEWGWLAVLWPFGLAVLWWAYSDKMGLTQKRAMDRMEERKAERRRKHLVALGIDPRDRERSERVRKARRAEVERVEERRAAERKHNKDVVARSSQFVDSSQLSPDDAGKR